jgi:hypothetical protein
MKVKVKELVDFLNKVTINGAIDDILMVFEKDGLTINAKDIAATGAVRGLLKREGNFQSYQEMEVPIGDTSRLIVILKMIEGNAELLIENNVFRVVGQNGVSGHIIMVDKKFVKSAFPAEKWPDLGYDTGFVVDAKIFDNARKAVAELTKKNPKDESGKQILASCRDGSFSLTVGESANSDRIEIGGEKASYKDAVATYGAVLLEFSVVMKGDLMISFDNNYPMLVVSENEGGFVEWFVSPILPKEE